MPRPSASKAARFACVAFALSIAGCGAGGVSISTSSPPNPATLDGNWLLAGSLPFVSPIQTGNNSFAIAMTFSVVGDQIVAGGSTQIPCSPSATAGGGIVVSGTVGPDGSFSAEASATQQAVLPTLQIKGDVPSSGTNSWTGTYSFAQTDSSCPFTVSGPISAVRIADLTGTYSGSASLSPPFGSTGSSQAVSVSFTLQQGQAEAGPAGTQSVDESVLTGTIAVQGTPCFSTGQIAQPIPAAVGSVLGTDVLATFTMNDGSQLSLTANIEDTASSKLGVINAMVSGGKCDSQIIGSFEALRQ